jgi:hypothetical protein
MRIEKFQIRNYKGFLDPTELTFSHGFNIVIGKNNAGKTALLEGLGLQFVGKPHRSSLSAPERTTPLNPLSSVEIEFALSGQEFRTILLTNVQSFFLPVPRDATEAGETLLNSLFSRPELRIRVGIDAQSGNLGPLRLAQFPTFGLYESPGPPNGKQFYRFQASSDKSRFSFVDQQGQPGENDVGLQVAHILRSQIYCFRAERLNVGVCNFGWSPLLHPDARNLPEVLNVLQSRNSPRFERFISFVNEVFPSILRVSVRPKQERENLIEIVVWTEDPKSERDDLAIELSDSGTGIGQVLAILYVVLNSDFPRTIIIDEPNSFLHPGAARKLTEILKRFPQHQYIISTHSPEIIRAADPDTVLLLRWEKPVSVIETVNIEKARDAQRCLLEVGARLSDVFGADQILWVEGPTEEACFPLILNKLAADVSLPSTSIVALRNTGDLEGKHAEAIVDIYTRLSKGNALIPQTVGFLLDLEKRTEKQKEDLSRRCGGLVQFLPRRTFENYLIHPATLKAVLDRLPTFQAGPVSEEQIRAWFAENGGKFIDGGTPPLKVDIADDDWLRAVHGAKLLEALFAELSGEKEEYRKTIHSVQLVEWLLQNDPNHLMALARFLVATISKEPSTTGGGSTSAAGRE